jgi:hypothetical protein
MEKLDPGSGINIPDPQHCLNFILTLEDDRLIELSGLDQLGFGRRKDSGGLLYLSGNDLTNYNLFMITINVPVVYMGRYEVVLRGDYP